MLRLLVRLEMTDAYVCLKAYVILMAYVIRMPKGIRVRMPLM